MHWWDEYVKHLASLPPRTPGGWIRGASIRTWCLSRSVRARELSIEEQQAACRAWAERNGIELIELPLDLEDASEGPSDD